jgi:hypothetical protein
VTDKNHQQEKARHRDTKPVGNSLLKNLCRTPHLALHTYASATHQRAQFTIAHTLL